MSEEIKTLQRELNEFTDTRLDGVARLIVDGTTDSLTRRRIRSVKYYLGYNGPRNSDANDEFKHRLRHPNTIRLSSAARVARGIARRIAQRKEHADNMNKARAASGVTRIDGVPVASWIVPYLQYARQHGWQGRLVSGWRDPAYSESLCRKMCGAPRCPGRCAGRVSNHSGKDKPSGAIDVSDYIRFGQIVAHCPRNPELINRLPNDRVHFSASGQ